MAKYQIIVDADGKHFLSEQDDGEHEGLDDALIEIRHAAPNQREFELVEADGYVSIWT